MLKTLLQTFLKLGGHQAYQSSTDKFAISYTGGDLTSWTTFLTYVAMYDGFLKLELYANSEEANVTVRSGYVGQTVTNPVAGTSMVMTVMCAKGVNVTVSGMNVKINSIEFIKSIGSS